MKRIIAIILLLTIALGMTGCNNTPEEEPKPVMADPVNDNYRTFYQVFVGSFSDSNNFTIDRSYWSYFSGGSSEKYFISQV